MTVNYRFLKTGNDFCNRHVMSALQNAFCNARRIDGRMIGCDKENSDEITGFMSTTDEIHFPFRRKDCLKDETLTGSWLTNRGDRFSDFIEKTSRCSLVCSPCILSGFAHQLGENLVRRLFHACQAIVVYGLLRHMRQSLWSSCLTGRVYKYKEKRQKKQALRLLFHISTGN